MKVKNFSGFMKARLNESMSGEYAEGEDFGYYGANPEDEEGGAALTDEMPEEGEEGAEGEGEEVTLEDLKAMLDEASGPINFTMMLTLFGDRLNGTIQLTKIIKNKK